MLKVIHNYGLFYCAEVKVDMDFKRIKFFNPNQNLKYAIIFKNDDDLAKYFDSIKHKEEIDLKEIAYPHTKNDLTGYLD